MAQKKVHGKPYTEKCTALSRQTKLTKSLTDMSKDGTFLPKDKNISVQEIVFSLIWQY